MDLLPTDEQQEIAAAASAFLAKEVPIAALRTRREERTAIDPATWRRCAALGWFGLGVAEADGGVGYGLAEEVMLFRELGRSLAPGPFLATSLAVHAAVALDRPDLVGRMLAGEAFAGLGLPRDPDMPVGHEVDGSLDLLDSEGAEVLLILCAGGAALAEPAGLGAVERLESIDPASRLARATARHSPAFLLQPAAAAALLTRGTVLAAAMLAGIAEATRDEAAAHARTRVQFGRPIGVHQAIKHRCADMALRSEAATSQVFFAAAAVAGGRQDAEFHAAAAKIVATSAAVDNGRHNIQIHGGQGYTFGNDANLYVKRAHTIAATMGSWRSHLGQLLDLPAAQ